MTHSAGGTRERLLSSENAYRSAFSSREVLRTVPHPTIGRSAALATTVVGLDNRCVLPPFPPSQRNEDGVFGLLTRLCVPAAYSAWLPPALAHLPPPRTFPEGAHLDSARGVRLSEVVIALLTGGTFHASLSGVGAYLVETASLSAPEFEEALRHAVALLASRRASVLHTTLGQAGLPDYARADITTYLERAARAVLQPDHWLPLDLDPTLDRRSYLRDWLRRYGELCRAWPALRAASVEIS
jgi:hypothetical protein